MPPLPLPEWNEGRSIHIGLDRVHEDVYQGWLPELSAASADALAMRRVADQMGCASRLLVNEAATLDAVMTALEATIERLVPGDLLLVTYAGHMTTLAGGGDDPDGWDEAWCLHDGILMDDQFHDLLAGAPEGSDIVVVTDSCFAAGMVDGAGPAFTPGFPPGGGPPGGGPLGGDTRIDSSLLTGMDPATLGLAGVGKTILARTPDARLGDLAIGRLVRQGIIPRSKALPSSLRKPIRASVVALAAAAEGSLAYEGSLHGLFTAALLVALEERGDVPTTYEELLDMISGNLASQTPSFGSFGAAGPNAILRPAFEPNSVTANRFE